MNQAVKSLALITISLLSLTTLSAQLKLPAVQGGISQDVKKVIEDYPNQFHNLQGELLIEHPQSVDYACNFKVQGAEKAMVTRYSSKNNDVCSWEALMLTTEDFNVASKKFKALYTQLNQLGVHMKGGGTFHLKGDYETPTEEKKFTTVVFSFQTDDEMMKRLKVEISILYEPMEWKVKVLVYNREREDDEKGPAID
ncbi:MAG TPA: hypothetical protein VFZ42_10250 [Chitinophagaceae bacterium]